MSRAATTAPVGHAATAQPVQAPTAERPIVFTESQAELLVDTACQIQTLMHALSVVAGAEDDVDHLREQARTLAFVSAELARDLSFALGDPKSTDWDTQHKKVRGTFPWVGRKS